jgi:hypothetical protein
VPRQTRTIIAALFVLLLGAGLCKSKVATPRSTRTANGSVKTSELQSEVETFLEKELTAHLLAINSVNPAPERVLGVPTTGEFSWGTFMRFARSVCRIEWQARTRGA